MRLTRGSLKNIKLIGLYFSLFIIAACTGTVSTLDSADTAYIDSFKKQLKQQSERIEQIEQKLILYQPKIDNDSIVNDAISQLRHELNNELKTTLDKLSTHSGLKHRQAL